uniref:MRPL25 domain-containing protein n=1 Tax=Tetraselmis chuii TaxID=63592 RepID=A0A7S1X0S4_9CHLO|mmetsp:Transcript_1711/g.2978  ORF Transcript_1711/g.2978 Transcript_1711/m.2978 type:complete len:126 (+) Transcript_1711:137-514(+)
MASRRVLEKLGEVALKPSHVNGRWRKAAVSAKNAARLRKEELVAGNEWPYEKPHSDSPYGQYKPAKGHKRHEEERARAKKIEENLKTADQKIADYRASKIIKDVPLLDSLVYTPKKIRAKAKAKA